MVVSKGFIEKVDYSEWALYGDTDSSYSKIRIPFSKFDDAHQTVNFITAMAKHFNDEYLDVFTDTIVKYGGVDNEYNMMFFKSEIIALRGFFNTKKNYALAKLWEEGKFFDDPEVKKTGGQILKSDSTKIVFELLTEIYKILILDFSITDETLLFRKIFREVKQKYLQKTEQSVKEMNYKDFGIPKKWSMSSLKTIPKQVQGAMLYNYLFDDVLRPGESVYQCQININPSRLMQYMDTQKAPSKFQLKMDMVSKLNVISFPVDMTDEDYQKVKKSFEELDIKFDLGVILDFNVNLKIDQFKKLFKEETIRLNS